MGSLVTFLNRILPFATPGTPLIQDLAHLAAVCTVLYFAPQIQQWFRTKRTRSTGGDEGSRMARTPVSATVNVNPNEDPDDDASEPASDEHHNVPATENAPLLVDDERNQQGAIRGPANPPQPPIQRAVGAKKAKALAKRDQRRAYNESLRIEGEQQRAKDAEGADEREAFLAEERERRRAVEAAIEAKKSREREVKREAERLERQQEMTRRELAVVMVRDALAESGRCDLWRIANAVGGDVDDEWVEKLLKATGVLGMRDGVLTMVTRVGWAVRVSRNDVSRMYQQVIEADIGVDQGVVTYDQLGGVLEKLLQPTVVSP